MEEEKNMIRKAKTEMFGIFLVSKILFSRPKMPPWEIAPSRPPLSQHHHPIRR